MKTSNTPGTTQLASSPAWMKRVLLAAALYNLAWGLFVILSPHSLFQWAGFETLPLYPEIWQCVGMIVGVYGIGYAIAARHPFIHWPVVLVGLLGKVFGPIGFLWAVYKGRFPASMGWTILTNDLIWWAPFTLILWEAAKVHQSHPPHLALRSPPALLDPLGRMVSQFGASLKELSRDQPLLLVFLRHSGCTFCRQTLSDLREQRSAIEANGVKIAVVHMDQKEPEDLLQKYELQDLHCFRDPQCALYELFGLSLGRPLQLLGPAVWWGGLKAWFRGHGIGSINGNPFRMPGAFLLWQGDVLRAYRHQSAADRPDYVQFSVIPDEAHASESVPKHDPAVVRA